MTELTLEQQELLPSQEKVEFYKEHGWYISEKIIPDDVIEECVAATQRFYAGERDFTLPIRIKEYLDWKPDNGECLRINDYIVLQNLQIQKLALNPLIGAIAGLLSDTDQIRLFNSSLIFKPPQMESENMKVGWHVDRAYWKTCTSDNMLTAWIPLQDCDERMGTLTVIDRSHRLPHTEMIKEARGEKTFICPDVAELERRLEASGIALRKVPIEIEKGQVSFHHCLTFHGSGCNHSATPRCAVVIHLQDRANRYRPFIDKNGEKYIYNNDLLCRKLEDGSPDYSDPSVCPVLWER